MSLKDYKITQGDIETKGVVAAPDVMSGDPQENKRIFDRLIREAVAEKLNDLVDELVSSGVEVILKRGDDSIRYIRLNADNVLEVSTDGVEYEATSSSGHTILDANGNTLPQRGKLQFPDGSVEDIAGVTVVKGIGGIPVAQKGAPNGVAQLGATGKVPTGQLPATMPPSAHTHTKSQITDFPITMPPNAHAASHKTGGSDPITTESIGALSTGGGALYGNLNLLNGDPILYLGTDSTATRFRLYSGKNAVYADGAGLILQNKNMSTDQGVFSLHAGNGAYTFVLKGTPLGILTWGSKNVFHERNKPTGTYTGNGSNTARTIDTGGIGNVCVIYSDNKTKMAIVTPAGAIVKTSSFGGNNLDASEVKFSAGVLTIATTNASLNTNNEVYHYQVL